MNAPVDQTQPQRAPRSPAAVREAFVWLGCDGVREYLEMIESFARSAQEAAKRGSDIELVLQVRAMQPWFIEAVNIVNKLERLRANTPAAREGEAA